MTINGNYESYIFPIDRGTNGQILITNGSGATSWFTLPNYLTSFTETDPIYGVSVASGVTATDTTNWNNKLDIEADPVFEAWDKDYADLINTPAAADGSETKVTAGTNITVTGTGTTASPYVVNATTHYIGESYGGGIVFYVYDNGQHGLIAATSDQITGIQWYNGTGRYTGAFGDGLYSGEMNTSMIVSTQMADNQTGNFAAKVCADYSVYVSGVNYGDWYLPSFYELELLYAQKAVVGGFALAFYWSSNEINATGAIDKNFATGTSGSRGKNNLANVRAVRAF